jgi:predicted nuclease of predicted toxin-antitoxin system
MKIIVDESVDYVIARDLQNNGFDISAIIDDSPGISDEDIINKANIEKAIIITADKDFGELTFKMNKTTKGIILIRLSGLDNQEKSKIVVNGIKKHVENISNSFCVISPTNFRIRKLLK